MASLPRIDVVIPAYNRQQLVMRAAESVLGQDGCDVLVWVVDDASTDATAAVVASAADADPRVRLLQHPVNAGVSAARNTGISAALAAGAQFVLLLDSDDRCTPGALRLLWGALAAQQAAACAHGKRIDMSEQAAGSSPAAGPVAAASSAAAGPVAAASSAAAGQMAAASSAAAGQMAAGTATEGIFLSGLLVRASTFERVGMFDGSMRVCEDLAWMASLTDAGLASVKLPEVTLLRALGSDNLTRDPEQMRQARLAWLRSRLLGQPRSAPS